MEGGLVIKDCDCGPPRLGFADLLGLGLGLGPGASEVDGIMAGGVGGVFVARVVDWGVKMSRTRPWSLTLAYPEP